MSFTTKIIKSAKHKDVLILSGPKGNRVKLDPGDKSFEKPTIHLPEIEPNHSFKKDINGLPKEATLANDKFKLRIYVPPLAQYRDKEFGGFERLFIMFNGFGESDPTIFDEIGMALANSNVPAILLPFPQHFVREFRFTPVLSDPYYLKIDDERDPWLRHAISQLSFQSLINNPFRLLIGWAQHIHDALYISAIIRGKVKGEYVNDLFLPTCTISLLGYSLGGITALSLMTRPFMSNEATSEKPTWLAGFILESGASFDQIKVNRLLSRSKQTVSNLYHYYFVNKNKFYPKFEKLFADEYDLDNTESKANMDNAKKVFNSTMERIMQQDKEAKCVEVDLNNYFEDEKVIRELLERNVLQANKIWNSTIKNLYAANQGSEKSDLGDITRNDINLFTQTFLGQKSLEQKEIYEKISDRLLFIVGGLDDIFPLSAIQNISPESGLALFQIPKISHYLKYGSKDEWHKWLKLILTVIMSFKIHLEELENGKLKVDFEALKKINFSYK